MNRRAFWKPPFSIQPSGIYGSSGHRIYESWVSKRIRAFFFQTWVRAEFVHFSCNLSHNIFALQVGKRCCPYHHRACATCCATTFSLANCSHMFHEVKDGSTFCNESWCLLIVLPLALQHATQQSRRKRFSLASPFKRAQVTSVRALTSQWTWRTKLMYSLRLGRLNYSTKNCLRLRTLTCTGPQKTIRQAFYYFHCEVSFYTYWDFHYEICCLKT